MDVIKQYLTFKLGEELFGVDVIQVREILEFIKAIKIPQTPHFMCGVINLRGGVLPVIDIKQKLGLGKIEKSLNANIIILEFELNDEKMHLGVLVDSVQEVIEFEHKDIEIVQKTGTNLKKEFIKGMGKRGDKFIILLDLNKIFSSNELEYIQDSSRLNI